MKMVYLSLDHTLKMVNAKRGEKCGKIICLGLIGENNIFRLSPITIWRNEWENQGGE